MGDAQGRVRFLFTPKFGRRVSGLESSQDHVIKESITCKSELADSGARIRIGFLQIAPADKDKGHNRRQDRAWWTLQKRKD